MRQRYVPVLAEGPLQLRLAQAITTDIRAGRLVPGQRLPGSRSLAATLGISRGVVVRALRELQSAGWLTSVPASGVHVCADIPAECATVGLPAEVGFDLAPADPPPATLSPASVPYVLAGGQADLRLLPLEQLARAYGRVLRRRGRRLVGYGDPAGEPRLIDALGQWLAEQRGVRPRPGGLLVTRGSQQALFLVAQALLQPADRVAVERYGYPPAWAAFRDAGAELVPVDIDAQGLCVEQLPEGLRAVYLTPHHQYPTGVPLSAARRLRLLDWARRHRVAIIEDDYDFEYHYAGPPLRPLVAEDVAGVVVSIGTLSKAFAPGLRLGWVVAPAPLVQQLVHRRLRVDRQGDRVVEHAVAELLEDGVLSRHVRRTRRIYAGRRAALLDALATELPAVQPRPVPGGMALWCHVNDQEVEDWSARCLEKGVYFETARRYAFDRRVAPFVRLGFAPHTEEELGEAVRRMRGAWLDTGRSGATG